MHWGLFKEIRSAHYRSKKGYPNNRAAFFLSDLRGLLNHNLLAVGFIANKKVYEINTRA
jgi:hypothetical protein